MEQIGWARGEMAGARVWDPRCLRSLVTICEKLALRAGESFSAALGSGTRQAAHRILEAPHSSVEGLLGGHFAQTALRSRDHPLVLAVQDTTEFDYSTHPATLGLGPLGSGERKGLLCHSVLAVTPEGLPLGLLHVALWARNPETPGQKHGRRRRLTGEKESQKWIEGLRGVEVALPPDQPVLVVGDREADVFAYLAAPRHPTTQLLIRACQPRAVPVTPGSRGSLLAVATTAPWVGQMRVRVPRKAGQPEREADLTVRAIAAEVQPPRHAKAGEPRTPQAVQIVCATEATPPTGEKAIQWILVTTQAVTTAAEACQMVRYYTRRWTIERLHFTLKSGCRAERLQIDDAASLKNALGLYYLVAWRLLWLTTVARTDPLTPAEEIMEEEERQVLEQAAGRPVRTAREAVRAVARLGGFAGSPSEGEPGVKSLWLGLRRLDAMVAGWRLAIAALSPMIHD
jgi:hypothetical protein